MIIVVSSIAFFYAVLASDPNIINLTLINVTCHMYECSMAHTVWVWCKCGETSLNKHWALKFFTTTLNMNLKNFIIFYTKTYYVESFENSVNFEIDIFNCIWISIPSRFYHWIYRFHGMFRSFLITWFLNSEVFALQFEGFRS